MKTEQKHVRELKPQMVTCTACQWEGPEDELGYFEDEDEEYGLACIEYCPACMDTDHLINSDILEKRLKLKMKMEKLKWRS